MQELMLAHSVTVLVVAAPPLTLAELRHAFPPDVQKHIIAEIDKDLAKHPLSEIERHLLGGQSEGLQCASIGPKGRWITSPYHYSRRNLEIGFIGTVGTPAWVEP